MEGYTQWAKGKGAFLNIFNSNFKVLKETSDGSTVGVKFTTSYTDEPETFKLIMDYGNWKVTERDKGERAPF
ncbi:hypothetical protein SAMN05444483_1013 [Salegentibacter echinorum]|uniref:DUF4878 domain-containing protein n=1 Tax=Salegentibacter echinorum TaxID=1073325 RepID=A0A1M5BES1_SALEC|nr:hypothetical protein SAMN05444483_1013 [Salegentibacter echinorum]